MNLLFYSTDSRPLIGGIASCLDSWLTGLAENGNHVQIVSALKPQYVSEVGNLEPRPYSEKWLSIPQRSSSFVDSFFPARKLRSYFYMQRRNRWLLSQMVSYIDQRPDWVIFSFVNPDCCIALARAKQLGIPCAAIAYGSELHPKHQPNPAWVRKTLQQMDQVIVISNYTQKLVMNWGVPIEKSAIIHPGLTQDFSKRRIPSLKNNQLINEIKIVTACRLIERKGVQTLLAAVARLKVQGIAVRLEIIGEGPYRFDLEKEVNRLGINDEVKFCGQVNNEQRQLIFANADVFALTPFETEDGDVEGFGIVYVEAGFEGLPTIGSFSGGVPDAVQDNITGLLVPPQNEVALAEALEKLASDPILRNKLGKAGQSWALDHKPAFLGKQLNSLLER